MIKKAFFVNKLRELDFTFVRPADRVELWRQRGSSRRVNVPRRDEIPEAHVIFSLRQCGLEEDEIRAFIQSAKS